MAIKRRWFVAAGVVAVAAGGATFGPDIVFSFLREDAAPVFAVDGLAIRGTDAVAYHTEGRAIQGSPNHETTWNGARWHFASAENKAAFDADPEAFAPQYGGFCAWAVAEKGQLYSTQPENFSIVDGKLYLNFNDDIQERWETDVPGFIALGDEKWPGILAAASAA